MKQYQKYIIVSARAHAYTCMIMNSHAIVYLFKDAIVAIARSSEIMMLPTALTLQKDLNLL